MEDLCTPDPLHRTPLLPTGLSPAQRSLSDSLFTVSSMEASFYGKENHTPNFTDHDNSDWLEEAVTLLEEVELKYGTARGLFSNGGGSVYMKMPSGSPVQQLPGKRTSAGWLELLVLNSRNIAKSGELRELENMISHVAEVDLADNQLSSWEEIRKILSLMPKMFHCNLSQNPLDRPMSVQALNHWNGFTMEKLSALILNSTKIQWQSLFQIMHSAPNLEELHLSKNNYGASGSLPPVDATTFPGIRVLHLNSCQINSWTRLKRICRLFPSLESLVAAENPINSFYESAEGLSTVQAEFRSVLGCLNSLNINKWELNDWKQIDILRHLPLLCELRLTKLPLLEEFTDEERRQLIVARLPDVTMLNGSAVTPQYRTDSERYFLRQISSTPTEQLPPRYHELVDIHGRLDPLPVIDLSPKQTAEVILIFENRLETKKIDLHQTIGEFKKTVMQEFCGIPPSRFRLLYLDQCAVGIFGMEEMKQWNRALWSLQVTDGDEFHAQTKPDWTPSCRRRTTSSGDTAPQSPSSGKHTTTRSPKKISVVSKSKPTAPSFNIKPEAESGQK